MAKPDVQLPPVRDPEDRFQRDVREAFGQLLRNPLLNGNLVEDVAVTTGTTRVAHGLGRPAVGFIVIDKTEGVDVWRDASVIALPEKFLPLQASGSTIISLWIF